MKSFRKIDTTTGNYLDDARFESHPVLMRESIVESMDELGVITQYSEWRPVLDSEGNPILDAQYVEQAPQQGFYLPRWNGTEWVEGGQAPEPVEPEPQAPSEAERIEMLENMLLLLMME